MTYTVMPEVACDLYNACKKNSFIASLAQGSSAVGFLDFMGSNAVETGLTLINMNYKDDPDKAMS